MTAANEEWTVEHGTATRLRAGSKVTLEIDDVLLSVEVEQGSGYLAQQTTAYVPLEVLAELLRGAGWVVTRGEAVTTGVDR